MRSRKRYAGKVKIAGVNYIIEYLPAGHLLLRTSATHNGTPCHGQTFYSDVENGPRIVLEKGQDGRMELWTLLHEGLHAIAPCVLDNDWIDERANELTALVYDVAGYRKG